MKVKKSTFKFLKIPSHTLIWILSKEVRNKKFRLELKAFWNLRNKLNSKLPLLFPGLLGSLKNLGNILFEYVSFSAILKQNKINVCFQGFFCTFKFQIRLWSMKKHDNFFNFFSIRMKKVFKKVSDWLKRDVTTDNNMTPGNKIKPFSNNIKLLIIKKVCLCSLPYSLKASISIEYLQWNFPTNHKVIQYDFYRLVISKWKDDIK